MFVVLDTNHYNELANDSGAGRKAEQRINLHHADVFVSIISIQESIQGWLALINRKKSGRAQLDAYARFQRCIETLSKMSILPFDEPAVRIFENLQRQRPPYRHNGFEDCCHLFGSRRLVAYAQFI